MKIVHVAHALPSRKVTNQDLIAEMVQRNRTRFSNKQLDELQQRMQLSFRISGTEVRYHRAEGEKAFSVGMKAGRLALERTGISPTEVDLLIYAGVGRGWLEPAMANIFQAELGLTRATCFDVLDACASWIRSLQLAKALIAAGVYRTVMILNCELNFREYANFDIERMEDRLSKHGWRYALLIRSAPIAPFGITSYALSLTPLKLSEYLLTTLATFPFLLTCVYLGSSGAVIVNQGGQIDGASMKSLAFLFTGVTLAFWLVTRLLPKLLLRILPPDIDSA